MGHARFSVEGVLSSLLWLVVECNIIFILFHCFNFNFYYFDWFSDKAQDIIRKSSINQNNNKNNELEVKKTDGKARKIVPLRMVEDSDNVNINKISNNISKNNINNNNNDNNNNKDNNDNVNKNSEDERKGSDIQVS